MINRKKRGFSLVEVMILFTILAVAMAAAIPVITKKSKPTPRKTSHGVYRCIALENGMFLEETYNSFRRLSSNEVNECNFNVPNVSLYKVDLYGAGAGGTLYAAFRPSNDDQRSATFTMNDARNYANGTSSSPIRQMQAVSGGSPYGDTPFEVTDDDIRLALRGEGIGESIIISAFTRNAGAGGKAKYSYNSPANAYCEAIYYGAQNSTYLQERQRTFNEKETAEKNYNDEYAREEAIITALQKQVTEKEAEIENLKKDITRYEGYQTILENYSNELLTLGDAASILLDEESSEQNVALADERFRSVAKKCLSKSCTGGITGFNIYSLYSPEKFLTYNNYKNDFYDKKQNVNDLIDSIPRENNPTDNNYITSVNQAVINARSAKNIADVYYANAETKIADIKNKITALENEINKLNDTDIPKAQQDMRDSIASGKLHELDEIITEKTKNYSDASDNYDKITTDKEKYSRPEAYDGATGYRFDLPEDKYERSNVGKQFDEYCKQHFPEYYAEGSAYNADDWWYEGRATWLTGPNQNIEQEGGDRGDGEWMRLQYYLNYGATERSRYSGDQFPFVHYIGDLYGNINNRGYQVVSCSQATQLTNQVCSTAEIETGTTGIPVEATGNTTSGANASRAAFVVSGHTHTLKANNNKGAGGDVARYLAFHVPDFTGNGRGSIVTTENFAATGGKAAAVGYETNDTVYQPNLLNTNMGWKVFKGEGDTKDKTKATSGENVGFSGNQVVANRYAVSSKVAAYYQEPEIRMNTSLFTKSYSMGQPGTPGTHRHIQTTTMGVRCDMHVPHAGPTFDRFALEREAASHGADVTTYLTNKLNEYQGNHILDASITCYDQEGVAVFTERANGGHYDITPSPWTQTFYWRRAEQPHSVSMGVNQPSAENMGIASRWAKVFHNMTQLYSGYGVGRAGTSTALVDNCVAPRGTWTFETYVKNGTQQGVWANVNKIAGVNTDRSRTYEGKNADGYDCYKDDDGQYTGVKTLDSTRMNDIEKEIFQVTPPAAAGGGAIVITW